MHPDTPPLEIVLQLYRGANNMPVVARETGRLVGMVSARDVLAALHAPEEALMHGEAAHAAVA